VLLLGSLSSIERYFRRNSIFVFFVAVFTAAEAPRIIVTGAVILA